MKLLLQGASFILMGVLLVTGLVLSGCGTSEEAAQATAESATLDSVKTDNQRLQSENVQLKKSNAQLEQDKKALNAKVADLTSKLGQSSQQWGDLVDLQNRVTTLDSELTVQKQINRDLIAKRADVEKQSMTGTESAVTTKPEFVERYNGALKAYRERKYKDAIADLESLAASPADSSLLSNTHYWLGECYYAMKRYNDAVQEFNNVLLYHKSYKKGDAYIMLGMSYVRLGDKEKARAAWEELVKTAPKSKDAAKAQTFLKQL